MDVLLRMAGADLRAVNRAETLKEAKAKLAGAEWKSFKALEIMRSEADARMQRDARRAAKPRATERAQEPPVFEIIIDRQPEIMPEEEREMFNAIAGAEEGTVRPEQITPQQMFVFGASIVVSALWVALLLKIGGWIALWLGVM